MSALGAVELPKPKDWQAFERALQVLAQSHFNDPVAQLNGRSGQGQKGVDVFGYRDSDQSRLFGLQAKRTEEPITKYELANEVKEARKFKPPLVEYFLITTTKRDAVLQEAAREINAQHAAANIAMRVTVWFWDDITEIAQNNAVIWTAFDPTHSNFAEREGAITRTLISNCADRHESRLDALSGKVDRLLERQEQSHASDALFAPDDAGSTARHGRITAWVGLVNDNQAKLAERYLVAEIEASWDNALPTERYRLKAALAGAKLKLGDFEAAAAVLTEAIELGEYPEKTAVNRAKIALLNSDYGKAEELSLNVIEQYPINEEIYGVLVQSRANQALDGDPREGVPEKFRTRPDVYAGYLHWLRGRDDDEWIGTAKRAADENPDSLYLKAIAAEGVLELVTGRRQGYVGGARPAALDHAALSAAAGILADYVQRQLDAGEFLDESVCHNAVLSLRIVGRSEKARSIFLGAIERYPASEPIILQGAILYLTSNEPEKALEIIPAAPVAVELRLLRIEMFVVGKQGDSALAELDAIDSGALPIEQRRLLDSIRARAISIAESKDAALGFLHEAQEEKPDDIHLRAIEIDVRASSGDRDGAALVLDQAMRLLTEASEFVDRYELAKEAVALDAYEAVVEILKGHVDSDRNSEGLQMLVMAALNAGLHGAAGEILGGLSGVVAGEPFMKRAAAVFAINTGNPEAEEKIVASLKAHPDDIAMTIARVLNRRSQKDNDGARQYLKTLDEKKLRGDPEDFFTLAQLLIQYGFQARGMSLGYTQLLQEWESAPLHLRYQGLVFGVGEDDRLIPQTPQVAIDTVVEASIDDGDPITFIIADEKFRAFSDHRLASDDPLAQRLIGASIGDEIEIIAGPHPRKYTIHSIRHKWLFAFQHSLATFEKRFPTTDGLRSIKCDPDTDDPYVELREMSRARAERADYVLGVYNQGGAPFCMLVESLGGDPVDAWRGLAAEGRKFHACVGTADERANAVLAINNAKKGGAVVDAVTIAMIKTFNIYDAVVSVVGPVKTTESVVAVFEKRVDELKIHEGKEYLSIAWRNGRLERTVIDEKGVVQALGFRQGELDWVRANFEIVTAVPREDPGGRWRETLEMLPRANVQAAAASQGGGFLLLSEDLGYRQWATATHGVQSVWLQPILLRAFEKSLISKFDYAEVMAAMVRRGHQYVSLNGPALIEIARRDDFRVSNDLGMMLDMIGGLNADLSTNPGVVASLIDAAILERGSAIETLALASGAFRAMARGRMDRKQAIVGLILNSMALQRAWMADHAARWVFGHSIGERKIERDGGSSKSKVSAKR